MSQTLSPAQSNAPSKQSKEQEHLVLKFGGSSVASPDSIRGVAKIIQDIQEKTTAQISVVFSAMGRIRDEEGKERVEGTSDVLKKAAEQAAEKNSEYSQSFQEISTRHLGAIEELFANEKKEQIENHIRQDLDRLEELLKACYVTESLSSQVLDEIWSFGERMSCYIISEFLKSEGKEVEYLSSADVIRTDNQHGEAVVDFEKSNSNIRSHYENTNALQVITGFIGRSSEGRITTLGRGASDYVAAIFGAALHAKEVQIWTDVDGFMTCDPRKVQKAVSIKNLSYEEAMEMAGFGSKVVHFPSMVPAMESDVPIRIMNTMNPAFEGTVISSDREEEESGVIKGISTITDVHLMTLKGAGLRGKIGAAEELFRALRDAGANVIMISQSSSENTITFAVDKSHSESAKKQVNEHFKESIAQGSLSPLEVQQDCSIIAIVGDNMQDRQGVAGRFFNTLSENGVNNLAFAQGSDQRNISSIIDSRNLKKALNALHDEFFIAAKTMNIIVIGPGGVGGTLIQEIQNNHAGILEKEGLELKMVGIANSRETHWNFTEGLKVDEEGNIEQGENTVREVTDLERLFNRIILENLANSVLVDATANAGVAQLAPRLLEKSIGVVTANKALMTGSMQQCRLAQEAAKKGNTVFDFETNVGASLPVLGTLRGLVETGNDIQQIFAIASGTLSKLFNEYDGTVPFSQLVRQLMEEGVTEPDPRKDLNGMDVAGKILVLARITGKEIELADIEVASLLDQADEQAKDVESFLTGLGQRDEHFQELYQKAQSEEKALRFVAEMKDGNVKVGLQAIDKSHPAARLQGTENLFQFTTSRSSVPITIMGAGAGRKETADGLLEGVIKIGKGRR